MVAIKSLLFSTALLFTATAVSAEALAAPTAAPKVLDERAEFDVISDIVSNAESIFSEVTSRGAEGVSSLTVSPVVETPGRPSDTFISTCLIVF